MGNRKSTVGWSDHQRSPWRKRTNVMPFELDQGVKTVANLHEYHESPTCPALRAGLFSQACGFSLRVWSGKSWPPHLQGCEVRMEQSPIPVGTGVLCGTVLDSQRVEVWSMWLCPRKLQIKIIKFEIRSVSSFQWIQTQLTNQISSGNSRLNPSILWNYQVASMDQSISGSSVAHGCGELSTPICWILATPNIESFTSLLCCGILWENSLTKPALRRC